jgi:hypothetical protein
MPARFLEPMPAQVGAHRLQQLMVRVEPVRHRLQLTADLVCRENIEYRGLDGAFLTHCGSGGGAFCCRFSGLHQQHNQNRRSSRPNKRNSSAYFNNLVFMDGH